MKIGGFQKTSLLDYPSEISCIIWTVGCNFSCPFCYNVDLVKKTTGVVSEEEIFSYLKKRKKMIDALVISGGEPLIHKDILSFCEKVKKIGYLIKIDTNGMFPEKLKELIDKKIIDYVAMDVKAPKEKYDVLSGVKTDISKIDKSIEIIKKSGIDYEFRTTFIPNLLEKKDIIKIAEWLKGAKKYYIQQFKNDIALVSSDLKNFTPYDEPYLEETLNMVKPFFETCEIRGS